MKEAETIKWKEETVDDESLVDKERTYQKESGGITTNLEKDDLMYNYKYGTKLCALQRTRFIHFTILSTEKMTKTLFNSIAGVEELASKYDYGGKCLSVLAFVNPIPSHYYLGSGTMYFFAQKDKANISVDRVS